MRKHSPWRSLSAMFKNSPLDYFLSVYYPPSYVVCYFINISHGGHRVCKNCCVLVWIEWHHLYDDVSGELRRRSKNGGGKSFFKLCRTLMSHTRQPFFLAAADALLATSWRRRTRQDVTQKASRRSLAAQIDFNFRFRDRLSFISLLDAPVPSPSTSLLVVP